MRRYEDPKTFKDAERRALAFHEAGHAAMAWSFKVSLVSASLQVIRENGGISLGRVRYRWLLGSDARLMEWYISRSGPLAEVWGWDGWCEPYAMWSDFDDIQGFIDAEALDDRVAEGGPEAKRLFDLKVQVIEKAIERRLEGLRPQVEKLAFELMIRGEMTGDEIEELFNTSPPIVATASPATVISEDLSADAPEKEINQCRETAAVFTPR